jgi:hypothetical protein
MVGSVDKDVTQQAAAPASATVRRQDVEATEASREFILATDAADANQSATGKQSEQALPSWLEPIATAFPFLPEARQKSESFALASRQEGLKLNRVECLEACNHARLAEFLVSRLL